MATQYASVSPESLAERLADGTAPRIVDVREGYEVRIAKLDAAEHKPLSEIQEWWTELDPEEEIVFYCHHGVRSAQVCAALAAEGFSNLINLTGGIDAWAARVDPEMARY